MVYVHSNKRKAGVRCVMTASCKRGMILMVDTAGAITWEVVRFHHTLGHELLWTFEHGSDAIALYSAEIKP